MNTHAGDEERPAENRERQGGEVKPLDKAEQERLDELLSSARRFHYTNLAIAGISWAFCSIEKKPDLQLPFTGLALPKVQASVALYFISVALAMVTNQCLRMAERWVVLDPRRPPYAWFALGIQGRVTMPVKLWAVTPLLLVTTATFFILGKDVVGIGLLIPGVFAAGLPFVVGNYLENIRLRTDQRGGPATFSIWLLYWYRIAYGVLYGMLCVVSGLGAIPAWRNAMLSLFYCFGLLLFVMMVARSICGYEWCYTRIDRWGIRHGFPQTSPHYSSRAK